ncbi:hypothetical protein [Dactylosporangium darangshiense]|uniref:Uncharacterized protein n=1 Tax=Dactylosporangium darangshiense TaxID=579108 RepID=A0ABP8CU43_9ACTN
MDDEIELISDGDGLAVIGNPTAVERFLDSVGLLSLSKELGLDRLGSVLGAGAGVIQAASEIAANSGRYVKLTKESAQLVNEFGLMKTKTRGVSHAMLGKPGSISKWLQIENGPGSLVTNPALLSGAAGIMAQFARQHEMNEITELLTTIDEKLDDVRRAQRDAVLAKMDGVASAIKEAMTIREHVGRVSEVAWSKVQATSVTIADTQAYALRQLDALAEKMESKTKVGDLAKTAKKIEREVGVWLAVLARCFQLQDEIAVLELDRVLDASPADLNGHRLALSVARQDRRELILRKTKYLMDRMDAAAGTANSNVLLHATTSRAVVDSINHVGIAVDDFHGPLGIESGRDSLKATRWWDAARDPRQLKNAGAEAGRIALVGAFGVGLTAASVVVAKKATKSGE